MKKLAFLLATTMILGVATDGAFAATHTTTKAKKVSVKQATSAKKLKIRPATKPKPVISLAANPTPTDTPTATPTPTVTPAPSTSPSIFSRFIHFVTSLFSGSTQATQANDDDAMSMVDTSTVTTETETATTEEVHIPTQIEIIETETDEEETHTVSVTPNVLTLNNAAGSTTPNGQTGGQVSGKTKGVESKEHHR